MTDPARLPPDPPSSGARMRRPVPLVIRLLFVVLLAFTFVGLVETAFVAYDYFTGAFSLLRAPDLGLGVRSWTVHHAMRPGYNEPATHTNSFGLRSPEVAVPKPTGTFRILLLGDSFTFGLQAPDHEVFARRLEEQLRDRTGSRTVEVVNAGVLSYCPLLEYLQYRHQLHVLEPDLVILNFDMSDVQDHLEYSRDLVSSSDGVPLYITETSLNRSPSAWPDLLSFQWVSRKIGAVRRRFEASRENVPFVRDLDRYIWALDDGPDMAVEARAAMAPIADLSRLLQHHGIPLAVATYPQPWQVARDATPDETIRNQYAIGLNTVHLNDRPFRKLEAFAAEHGLPFVNATAAFRGAPEPAGLFLKKDFHFSARGNELYADVLADYVVQRWLPPGIARTPN